VQSSQPQIDEEKKRLVSGKKAITKINADLKTDGHELDKLVTLANTVSFCDLKMNKPD
jgi:hypothetical protein